MSPQFYRKSLRGWMIAFAIGFFVTTLQFLFLREELFRLMNAIAKLVGHPPTPESDGNFWLWLALTNSMMIMITYMSAAIAWKPERYFNYLPVIILSKFTSSLTGLVFYFTVRCKSAVCLLDGGLDGIPYFSSLIVFTTDFPLGVIGVVLYLQGKKYLKLDGATRSSAAV